MTKEYIIKKLSSELSDIVGTIETLPIITRYITWAYEAGFSNANYIRKDTIRVGLYATDTDELVYTFNSINEAAYSTNTPSVRIGVRVNHEYKNLAYKLKKPYYFKIESKK